MASMQVLVQILQEVQILAMLCILWKAYFMGKNMMLGPDKPYFQLSVQFKSV